MGNEGDEGDEGGGTRINNHSPCPMPNAQCPMPNAQCPMPNAQCPMPNAPFPILSSDSLLNIAKLAKEIKIKAS